MKSYDTFVHQLESLLASSHANPQSFRKEIEIATNGLAKSELYRLVPTSLRRKHGAFFTDESLAKTAAKFLEPVIKRGERICDPACGAGDLLLACTQYLPRGGSIKQKIETWNSSLMGWDLQPSFVRACQIRLLLRAIAQRQDGVQVCPSPSELFSNIQQADGLAQSVHLGSLGGVIMNPPFTSVKSPEHIGWGNGKINASALFTHHVLAQMRSDAKMVAILPDVLRSGSRYRKWRIEIERLANISRVIPLKKFDPTTDVHVFMLVAVKRAKNTIVTIQPRIAHEKRITKASWQDSCRNQAYIDQQSPKELSVSDFFVASVGPVVEYREPRLGQWLPYLQARNLPRWSSVESCDLPKRRFRGRRIAGPFVVVRRTSRPEDTYRVVGTIVSGQEEYAVENHLIVLKPRDGKLSSCRRLLKLFKNTATTDYVNKVMRCRHLTISTINSIPWANLP
ncbi:N-6 DNA methylase [Bremerella sp. T1]|uniref:N-6 DNA methylase n=1 Tax=Bremerella sp. TYQ1 TaxID=3119568 RepID=UPI001CCA04B6|nr:N-6 DNA methylase [Bremerella volcania]UBM38443.1 SAM-dependent methyltransferase [Bremerella volcania]